jgi:hypothetical protein
MCLEHDIHLQAYAPLLSKNVQDLLNNATLQTIAEKHEAINPASGISLVDGTQHYRLAQKHESQTLVRKLSIAKRSTG